MIDPITQYILEKDNGYIGDEIFIESFVDYQMLTEDIKSFKLNAIGEHFRNSLNKIGNVLKKFGINAHELIKKGKTVIYPKILNMYKKGLTAEKAAKSLIKELLKIVMSYLKKAVKKIKELNKPAKFVLALVVAIAVILLVFLLNTAIVTLMIENLGFAMWDAFRIGAVVVAPFVEEAMKTLFISLGIGYVGTVLFSAYESIIQGMMWSKNIAKPEFIISRIATTVMHLLTVRAQKDVAEKHKDDKMTKKLFNMWITGVVIHSIANILFLIRSGDQMRMIFDPTYWKYYLAPLFS